MELIILFLTWGSLLVAPPLAILMFIFIQQIFPHIQLSIIKGSALSFALAIVFLFLKIAFAEALANCICFVTLYYLYCYSSLALCWRIPNKNIGSFVLACAALPVCIGYVLGTIGMLVFGFIVLDFARSPSHVEHMRSGLVCETTLWGMVFSDEGYVVKLYRFWSIIPFIRQEVIRISVDQSAGDARASCSNALAKYDK